MIKNKRLLYNFSILSLRWQTVVFAAFIGGLLAILSGLPVWFGLLGAVGIASKRKAFSQ
jgi:hypothetical protein